MSRRDKLKQQQLKLNKRYKQLVEEAYNLRQTNHEESDLSEYRALKLLDKLNKLKFLVRDSPQSLS
ncbi:uncharacterized membrane protein YgaE (UPF0421/DUF939 family) [Mesoflavibacter sabulilitoris]|uniref:Lacal_2735 family protein n=1 Tax=Mesoflavibacter zeaxanthinifaciens subsp. sabulilitoris TaxID=1520893 RepID=A0A2T1NAL4_9FLAO|nr:Lacal_2735 family protein [Mesoflavibacter zeaxanthinifaciens]MBB3123699.1 uncharacterized membrane protein YgaE (UPF0421/DUF939 family) [Mesoflavibacter zeaxanthinifaciens subsp. sabulilitoris]MCP4055513.1 Lacal_2735 family protein [Mesoflavibacter sp.]PSG89179.1 Lacal_2735 family protein [Mesoflavibacter zeaxanthinifaciens subsp. sabulilitoris]|tara:strand:- start:25 stop:222 length:198 start_codon:yes stop_codon:yes gene_type:complete